MSPPYHMLLRRGTPLQIVPSDLVPLMSSHAKMKGPHQVQILAHRNKRQLCFGRRGGIVSRLHPELTHHSMSAIHQS
eukprot:3279625-Pleurochrysis_carterae.AAC.1